MPEQVIHADTTLELEVRDFDRREIHVRLIPFNEKIRVRGRPESFARGATAGIHPTSIKLLSFHDQNRPIGKAVSLEEREDGAYAIFRVSKTREGDEMLELANDGVLGVSPGFIPGTQTTAGVHTRLKALPEASLVTFAAYPSAQVLAVRKDETMSEEKDPKPEETKIETRSKDLEELQERVEELVETLDTRNADVDELQKRYDKLESTVNAPAKGGGRLVSATLSPVNWGLALLEEFIDRPQRRQKIDEEFAKLAKRVKEGEIETRDIYDELGVETRALADITGGQSQAGDNSPADDLSGSVVEEFMADQLVNVLDRRRPIFNALGRMRMPKSGYARIPTVTQHTVVEARGTQKTEVPSQKMVLSTAPFEGEWLAGAVDIALEIRKTSELDILALVVSDLFGQYAKATERDTNAGSHGAPVGLVPFIEAGGHGFTYTGTALDVSDYESFIADVYEYQDAVEDATDVDADVLVVTRAQFRTIAGFVDANDRRLFSVLGAQNADARAGFQAKSIQLPDGPTIVKARYDGLTQAFITNSEAFKVAEGGPEQIGPVRNVGLMGDDVGILGRTMIVPRIPSGVVVFGTDPESS